MVTFDLATSGNFSDVCYGVTYVDSILGHWVSQRNEDPAEMTIHPAKLVQLVLELEEFAEEGMLYGWGSLGFDCRLLYQESEAKQEAINLAYNHCDLFFNLAVNTGFWVSLPEVAQYHGVSLDPHMGRKVAELWRSGKQGQRLVIQHHVNSARAVAMAAYNVHNTNCLSWIDKKTGRTVTQHLLPLKNRYYLEKLLALPHAALAKTVAEPTQWLRELQQEPEVEYES